MKTKTLTLLLLIGMISMAYSQRFNEPRNFDIVFALGVDPKMAIEGPHNGKPGNEPSLDIEFSFGLDWERARLLTQLKSHKAVNFLKWTYLQLDYKQELFKNMYVYGGVEMSQIRIYHPDASYDQPDNYRDYTTNPILFGANLEIQYKIFNDNAGIAIQGSMYQAEDDLKPYKKYRKDVTVALFVYF